MVRGAGADGVVSITSAPITRAEEQAARQRRYLISMTIRVVCFLGAILVGPHWYRWLLVLAAVVLPYVAVVGANAANNRQTSDTPESPGLQHPELHPKS